MSDLISAMTAYAQIRQQQQLDNAAWRMASSAIPGARGTFHVSEYSPVPLGGGMTLSLPKHNNKRIDLSQGGLKSTGNPFHVSLSGSGFFKVQTNDGRTLLTRRGNFKLDTANQLITAEGYKVLAGGNPVSIDPTDPRFMIQKDGTMVSSAGSLGKLDVVMPQDVSQLIPVDGAYFDLGNGGEVPVEGTSVHQGALEGSNVLATREAANVALIAQESKTTQRLVSETYERRKKFISELGNREGN